MPETGNDGRRNRRGSYLSLNYVNTILKLHILTNRTYWLSPLRQIRNRENVGPGTRRVMI